MAHIMVAQAAEGADKLNDRSSVHGLRLCIHAQPLALTHSFHRHLSSHLHLEPQSGFSLSPQIDQEGVLL